MFVILYSTLDPCTIGRWRREIDGVENGDLAGGRVPEMLAAALDRCRLGHGIETLGIERVLLAKEVPRMRSRVPEQHAKTLLASPQQEGKMNQHTFR